MTQEKKEAIEFCLTKFVLNRKVDIWLTVILTLGLALIFFPIFIWLLYRHSKAKKQVKALMDDLNNNLEKFNQMDTNYGFSFNRDGEQVSNSVCLNIDDESFDVPQLYIWFSKYKSKERLAEVLNA